MAKKIIIVGSKGKMGLAASEILKNYYEIIKIDKGDEMGDFGAEMVIDFGSAESSVASAEYCFKKRIPLIVGSTGQSESELEKIRQVASVAPLLICSNFSMGMVLVRKCIETILSVDDLDICIFEKHHKNKKDSPSGTALSLEKFIGEHTNSKVQILAERGGEEIGTHKLDFYFGSELVSISHQAFSRKAFADGVKMAVDFMMQNTSPCEYNFDEIIVENLFQNNKL